MARAIIACESGSWRSSGGASRCALKGPRPCAGAFTLIELILVMAILTMAVALTAPTLANFFRGRTLDLEARRLLALTHSGRNRAVSEGIPMNLWINPDDGSVGLDAEPSFEKQDPMAVEFKLDGGLHIEVGKADVVPAAKTTLVPGQLTSTASVTPAHLTHPALPTIRFLPDGTVSDTSPSKLQLIARNGSSLWVALARDRLKYEIRSTNRQ